MKSKIVNRKNLNKLGEDLKLTNLLQKQNNSSALGKISPEIYLKP
jgi:ribonuclease-3